MAWEFDNERPIWVQVSERIRLRIVSGEYPAGSKLPTVRDFAAKAAVNPNTVQRALSDLESTGLVLTQRTVGRTVTDDVKLISDAREDLAKQYFIAYINKMKELGFNIHESSDWIKTHYTEVLKDE